MRPEWLAEGRRVWYTPQQPRESCMRGWHVITSCWDEDGLGVRVVTDRILEAAPGRWWALLGDGFTAGPEPEEGTL